MRTFTWGRSALKVMGKTRSAPVATVPICGMITIRKGVISVSISQQILYSAEQVQQLVASAYQSGVNHGYTLAVQEEALELEAMKKEQERQAIIIWQGICESGQAGEPWD